MNCTTTAILSVCFSPDGSQLATGSGDCTVRIWDMNTETPKWTLKGHSNWVQVLAWSPDNQILSSGSMDSTIRLWNPKTGNIDSVVVQFSDMIQFDSIYFNTQISNISTHSQINNR